MPFAERGEGEKRSKKEKSIIRQSEDDAQESIEPSAAGRCAHCSMFETNRCCKPCINCSKSSSTVPCCACNNISFKASKSRLLRFSSPIPGPVLFSSWRLANTEETSSAFDSTSGGRAATRAIRIPESLATAQATYHSASRSRPHSLLCKA